MADFGGADLEAFRAEARSWLEANFPAPLRADPERVTRAMAGNAARDEDFLVWKGRMADKGWGTPTWPKAYGGQERSFLERYVVTEEMRVANAPVRHFFVADRQSGPTLIRYANERIKREVLPRIVRGDAFFCIGMSEPDSGSDLASVRTRAEPVGDGFRVNGTKIWTSGAHRNHYCIALVRTSGQHGDRHKGLSQILVDLKTPGVTIRPVINLAGRHEWNEVTFTDAFIPKDCLIGNEGDGWKQVTSELAFERAGPERFLQNFHVLGELVRVLGRHPSKRVAAILGRLVARLWTLRQMAVALAGMLQDGKSPVIEAALVKDLGTIYQQDLPEIARVLAESDATDEDLLADFLDIAQYSTMIAPSFTIQGGTTQVLRGMVARGLGLR